MSSNITKDAAGGDEPPMSLEPRLAAIETAMPYIATKEDVANLRADTYKWLIGTGVAVVVTILGAILPFLIPLFNSIAEK